MGENRQLPSLPLGENRSPGKKSTRCLATVKFSCSNLNVSDARGLQTTLFEKEAHQAAIYTQAVLQD